MDTLSVRSVIAATRSGLPPGLQRTGALLIMLVTTCLLTLAMPNLTHAAEKNYTDLTHKASNNFVAPGNASISAKRAASIARRQVDGRVLAIKPRVSEGGWHVRMLAEGGRVITVAIDAQGRVQSQ